MHAFSRSWGLRALGRSLDSLFYPATCPVCGADLLDDPRLARGRPDPRRAALHPSCLQTLDPCAALRPRARPVREGIEVHALFEDSPGWFALLHRIKYAGEFSLLPACADWLAAAIVAGGTVDPRAILVPVPDDPARRRERGFSPVGMLATELASSLALPRHEGLLRRARPGPSQTTMPSDEARAANLRGVLRTGDLSAIAIDRPLYLLEDQVTSGATVAACVARLGARGHRIVVIALARAARAPARVHP